MRQSIVTDYDPRPGISISTLAYEYPADFHVPEHAHGADQLIYATSGLMEVSAGRRLWLIPPQFAVWIPARTRHQIQMRGSVSMRTLYLRRGLAHDLPDKCAVFHILPLLRELVVEVVRIGQLRTRNRLHCSLKDLLVSQLQNAPSVPTFVILPADRRALAVARTLMENQAAGSPLQILCSNVGVSVRTLERIFRREVGVTFEEWRRQVRLMKAIEQLVGGCTVKEAAFRVGYRHPSNFVEMFRQTLGATPKVWLSMIRRSD